MVTPMLRQDFVTAARRLLSAEKELAAAKAKLAET